MDIIEATSKINSILEHLERDSGQLVEEIALHDIDVTTCADSHAQWSRTVYIGLKRLPGTKWAK